MDDIRKYENLAKLALSDEERALLETRIEKLEQSFRRVKDADAGGAEPLISVPDMQNVLREDAAKQFITRDELLSGAPEQYDGYFQVPKTIE